MFDHLSESARLYLKESLPRQLVSAVVKGLVPLEPKELLIVIAYHYTNGDEQTKADAVNTLGSLPSGIIDSVILEDVPDFVLQFIYVNHRLSHGSVYSFVTNKNLSDDTFIELAKSDDEAVLELVAKNQMRILKNDGIFDALITNPHLPKISKDQLIEFFTTAAGRQLGRLNIKIEKKDVAQPQKLADLPSAVGRTAGLPSDRTSSDLPSDLQRSGLPSDAAMLPADRSTADLPSDALDNLPINFMTAGLPSELIEEQEEGGGPDQAGAETEAGKLTLYQRIQKMTVSQKIKLALLGNKEARTILLRDSNRVVVESVMKSPRITDGEILGIANSRNVSEDIIRMIAGNREWQKSYRVRQALAGNSKTPVPIALRLLETISKQDLKNLSNSKNVSSVVASAAKRMTGDVK
ncbi:MAG: hypothetical protein M1491_08490 [Deltaproteobacteria bacterium]|nr:hypothetical protein [Deltaproteobacteria bacterium]MCL5277709.1 hypothetical protein [Deltaproteobacteria bacterium]